MQIINKVSEKVTKFVTKHPLITEYLLVPFLLHLGDKLFWILVGLLIN